MAAQTKNPKPLFEKIAIVMAGGSGTRFWPLSTHKTPKQYLSLLGKNSLIQDTVKRLGTVFSNKNTMIVSTENQKSILRKQLPKVKNLVFEPEGKNTAPCLMLAVKTLIDQGYPKDSVIGVFPADHTISDSKRFESLMTEAVHFAFQTNGIVTLGIVPTHPHTGYGYIQKRGNVSGWESVFQVSQFKEKPDLETAQKYLDSKQYYWNAGIFIFRLDTITAAFEEFLPDEWSELLKAKNSFQIRKVYKKLTAQPFDVAVLEKSPFVYLIPAEMGWNDIGSWNAVTELVSNDANGNYASDSSALMLESKNNYIHLSSKKKIAVIGCENLIVVETKDSILICSKTLDQKVREAAKTFDK